MRRILRNFLAILSLIICLSFVGLQVRNWVRWTWRYPFFLIEAGQTGQVMSPGQRLYSVGVYDSTLSFGYYHGMPPVPIPKTTSPNGQIKDDFTDVERRRIYLHPAGFLLMRNPVLGSQRDGTSIICGMWHSFGIPYYLIILITGIAPVRVLARHLRRSQKTFGFCQRCNYDLRASPDRCPECGTPTPLLSAVF